MEEKLTAILTQPGFTPIEVNILDVDGKSGRAFVLSPSGMELYVNIRDLHGVESVDKTGKYKFLGDPPRADSPSILEALNAPIVGTITPDGMIRWNKATAPTSSKGGGQEAMKKPAVEIIQQECDHCGGTGYELSLRRPCPKCNKGE